jgi:excinuclease ABC subunit C
MEEVVFRRVAGGLEAGDLPDLIVIDGGPPQLRRALDAARRAGLDPTRTELVGLAKARALPLADDGAPGEVAPGEDLPERAFERVHLPRGGPPVVLAPASLECRLLARIRDEAHRTAIRFHRELRRKSALRSGLEEVPGVGPTRRKALLGRFGSLRRIREASVAELAEVLPQGVAETVFRFLRAPEAPDAPGAADAPEAAQAAR